MNVLFFIPFLSKSFGGVYQYAIALLKNLLKNAGNKNKFFIYHKGINEDLNLLAIQHPDQIVLLSDDEIKQPTVYAWRRRTFQLAELFCRKLNLKLKINHYSYVDHLIKRYAIRLIHSPTAYLPDHVNIPNIVTIHDVQHLHYPEYFSREEIIKREVGFRKAIDQADAVIVSFDHIKKDVVHFFKKEPWKIHVCLLNMDDLWIDQFDHNDILDLKEYDLPENFIFYPAATWEHKNHKTLLEALHYLKNKKNILVHLVCTGNKTNYYPALLSKIEELDLKAQVKFLGVVPDQIMFSLYRQCKCVVIPTLYEAGSFPLVESILLCIPVICSSVSSLPETIGDTQFTFSPKDPIELATMIERMMYDPYFSEMNIRNSTEQSVKLRNNNASAIVNYIYSNLIKEPS